MSEVATRLDQTLVRLAFPQRATPIVVDNLVDFLASVQSLYSFAFTELGKGGRRRGPVLRKLEISRIRFESPGLIEFITASSMSIGAIWILLQTVERLSLWNLSKTKLRLEIQKLEREVDAIAKHRQDEIIQKVIEVMSSRLDRLRVIPLVPSDITVVSRLDDG